MVSALVVTTLVEHPASPIRQMLPDPLRRRALIGVAMGLTAASIIYSPWGRQSGAHFNPSVTLTFLRLGKITPRDALFYVMAQFAGAQPEWRSWRRPVAADRQRSRRELRGHRARRTGRTGRVSGRAHHLVRHDDDDPARVELRAVCVDDRRDRRVHGRGLHHVRSASFGHEHEPREKLRSRASPPARPDRSGSTSSRHRSACCWPPSSTFGCSAAAPSGAPSSTILRPDTAIFGCSERFRRTPEFPRGDSHEQRRTTTSSSSAAAPAAARWRYRLAPSGARILLLERGDYVRAREGQLELARGQRRGEVPHEGVVDGRATASPCIRTRTTTSAATPNSTAPRCSGCGGRTSASFGITAACRRPGRSRYDELEPYYAEAEQSLPRARRTRRGPHGAARGQRPYPYPAVSHEPRIQQLSDDFRRRACGRSTCRSASCWTSSMPQPSACIRCDTCDGFPCLRPREVRRAGRVRRSRTRATRTSRC